MDENMTTCFKSSETDEWFVNECKPGYAISEDVKSCEELDDPNCTNMDNSLCTNCKDGYGFMDEILYYQCLPCDDYFPAGTCKKCTYDQLSHKCTEAYHGYMTSSSLED